MPAPASSSTSKRILVGVCGGIAAYKMAEVVSMLAQRGDDVTVAMTRDARRFIGVSTLQSLSGRAVFVNPWRHRESPESPHIALAREADVMLVAPCTMDMLSKLVHGRTDDVVTLILSAINRENTPVVLAPAMNDQMWNQPSNLRNVALAEQDGFLQVGPGVGWQACRHSGTGRMSEPEDICRVICETLG